MPNSGPRLISEFLTGLSFRSQLIECPLNAYEVTVTKCSGAGDCTSVCPVSVFRKGSQGKCTVVNQELCFGCMACVAQCAENGVAVEPRSARKYPTADDLLR